MDDVLRRQFSLIRRAIVDYRSDSLSLNQLVHRIEAIGNVIGGPLWEERLFEIVLNLEGFNSELIDKNRQMTPSERERIEDLLSDLEAIVNE